MPDVRQYHGVHDDRLRIRFERAWDRRRALRPNAWYLLCELLDVDDEIVRISSSALALQLGVGRDLIRTALRELETKGLLVPVLARNEGGRFGPRTYLVAPSPAAARPAPGSPSPVTRAPRTSDTAHPRAATQLTLMPNDPQA